MTCQSLVGAMVRHANRRSTCTVSGALGDNNQHLEPMAPGFEPDVALSLSSDGLNHAQTSELGRLSIGKGGLPLGR